MESRSNNVQQQIRGCLIGGAAGDALGYEVEFCSEHEIFSRYGAGGIQQYALDPATGKALISDDTQMTLFTANGLLFRETRGYLRGIAGEVSEYVAFSYRDWLLTQRMSFTQAQQQGGRQRQRVSWLLDVPELFSLRAPGNTCLSALEQLESGRERADVDHPINNSKGCGGVMRVAPMGLLHHVESSMEALDREGANLAAITHGHPLGYLPAAVLTHIIHRIVYPQAALSLKEIVLEAKETVAAAFATTDGIDTLTALIDRAVALAEGEDSDLENIHRLGEGWVGEEALAIALYCALRHQTDFSAGIIAAVNHRGDSDSTGAITGNILGAWLGFDAINDRWKTDLELYDVILEIADDLARGCPVREYSSDNDPVWIDKYVHCIRR